VLEIVERKAEKKFPCTRLIQFAVRDPARVPEGKFFPKECGEDSALRVHLRRVLPPSNFSSPEKISGKGFRERLAVLCREQYGVGKFRMHSPSWRRNGNVLAGSSRIQLADPGTSSGGRSPFLPNAE